MAVDKDINRYITMTVEVGVAGRGAAAVTCFDLIGAGKFYIKISIQIYASCLFQERRHRAGLLDYADSFGLNNSIQSIGVFVFIYVRWADIDAFVTDIFK
ncbi:MAG: hypothetical protein ACOX6W_05770 [Lentisphaeria bacterium]